MDKHFSWKFALFAFIAYFALLGIYEIVTGKAPSALQIVIGIPWAIAAGFIGMRLENKS